MLIHDVLPACFPIYFHFGKRMVKQPVLFCTDIVPHCTNLIILFPSFIPHNYGGMPINRAFPPFPLSGPVGILLEWLESVVFATIFPTSGKWLWGNMMLIWLYNNMNKSAFHLHFDMRLCRYNKRMEA